MVKVQVFFLLAIMVQFSWPVKAEEVDIIELRQKAVSTYRACKQKKRLSTCKMAIGYYKKARQLIGNKPDINARIKEIYAIIRSIKPRTKPKYKSLILAVRMGYVTDVRYYLKHGVNVDAMDSTGRTALHYASTLGLAGLKVLKLLLKAGADPNTADNRGMTPLHLAAISGCVPAIKTLLKARADPEITNHDGKTAFDLATGPAKSALSARLNVHTQPNALVKLDGHTIGFTDNAGVLSTIVSPGNHMITVKKTGYRTRNIFIILHIGDQEVLVTMVSDSKPKQKSMAKGGPEPVEHTIIATPVSRPGFTLHKWGTASLISGVVFLGVGGLMTGLANKTVNDINTANTPQDMESKYSRLHTYNALAITSYILGSAFIGTGIYLWVRKPHTSKISAIVSPNSMGISVRY